MTLTTYQAYLNRAKQIEQALFPAPASHRDFCERVNRVGAIAEMLIKFEQK